MGKMVQVPPLFYVDHLILKEILLPVETFDGVF